MIDRPDRNTIDFQTHPEIAEYMAAMVNYSPDSLYLEPTSGKGNIVKALDQRGVHAEAPNNFWELLRYRAGRDHLPKYHYTIMNPPFTPMTEGYEYLDKVMGISENIIALMPWLTMINSDKRTKAIMGYGLKSITHLPRNAFKGSRVQCCILEMIGGHKGPIDFKYFEFKKK